MEIKNTGFILTGLLILFAVIVIGTDSWHIGRYNPNFGYVSPSPELTPLPNPSVVTDYRYIHYPNEEKIKYAFEKLPSMPFDFQAVRTKFYSGQLSTERVTEKYWKQPEFYEDWETYGISSFVFGKPEGYSIAGYGAFPSEYIALTKRNDEFEIRFYVRAAFGTVFYQGTKIETYYPETVSMRKNFYLDTSRDVNQSPDYVIKHIKVISITPKEFILEPTFNYQIYEYNDNNEIIKGEAIPPRIEYEWVKEIKIRFKIEDLDAGKYSVVFNLVPPSDEFSFVSSDKYLTRYLEAGSSISTGWLFGVFFDVQ